MKVGELGRLHAAGRHALFLEAFHHVRLLQHARHLGVQALHQLGRRAVRRHEREPGGHVVALEAGSRRAWVRRGRRASAVFVVTASACTLPARMCGCGRGAGFDGHLDLPAHQVGHHRRAALVGHVHDVGLRRCRAEQLARDVLRAAVARRAVVDLARVGLDVGDEFGHRFHGHLLVHDQHVGRGRHQRHRIEVALEVVGQALVEARRDRMGDGGQQQGVAIRPGAFDTMAAPWCRPRRGGCPSSPAGSALPPSFWPTVRPTMSVVPPAAKGTTRVMGLAGQSAALEDAAAVASSRAAMQVRRKVEGVGGGFFMVWMSWGCCYWLLKRARASRHAGSAAAGCVPSAAGCRERSLPRGPHCRPNGRRCGA